MKKLAKALTSTLLGLALSGLMGGAVPLLGGDAPWRPKLSQRGPWDTQSVIVKFRPNAGKHERYAAAAVVNGTFKDKQQRGVDDRFDRIAEGTLALIEMRETKGRDAATGALEALRRHPAVEYAEYNYTVQADATPNDPRFGELWAMNNTGQSGGKVGADIRALAAWDITKGSPDVVVGIIDTGVDYTHQDLAANMWTNPGEVPGNGIDDDGNGYVDDVHGINAITGTGNPMDDNEHGSHCAGTIGGTGNNALGVVGVNWQVRLIGMKFLDSGGSGSTADAITCINYAIGLRQRGVNLRVLSNSWGGGGFEQSLLDAINAANGAGILFVAAAGNSGTDNDASPHYPSSYGAPNVLAVASTDRYDALSSFSCYGATSVDLGAPGSSILSTVPGNGYAVFSGTSMATPHVAGAAALLLSRNGTLSTADLKTYLMDSGDALPALAGKTVSGRRLNLYQALQLVPDPQPSFLLSATPSGRILNQGDTTTYTIAVGSVMGYTSPVTLSVTAVPVLDAAISFSPNPVVPGGSSTMTLATTQATAVGDYTLTVTGVSGSITKTTTVTLKVRPYGTVERTYTNTTPVSIPDNVAAGVTSAIDVPDALILGATSVAVRITHTYIGDLQVKLRSPAGTETVLHDRSGGGTDNLYATFTPTAFNTQNAAGRWTLSVADLASIDTGTLDQWSLTLTGTQGGPPVNQAPTADYAYTSTRKTGSFTDLSTDSDGSLVAWSWNFGDGGTSAERHPTHVYTKGGTYTVALTVTDNAGATGTVSKRVNIKR